MPAYSAQMPARTATTRRRLLQGALPLTTGCRPVKRAKLDVWQADARGVCDDAGFRLRGHRFTGAGIVRDFVAEAA